MKVKEYVDLFEQNNIPILKSHLSGIRYKIENSDFFITENEMNLDLFDFIQSYNHTGKETIRKLTNFYNGLDRNIKINEFLND